MRRKDEDALEAYSFLSRAGEDIPGELAAGERRLRRSLLLLTSGCLALFLLLGVMGLRREDLSDLLQRPAYGDGDGSALVHLRMEYGGSSWEEDVSLDIPARELNQKEARELLDRCEVWLRSDVFGREQDLARVTGDLDLPLSFERGAVELSWTSSDPGRISEEGLVDLIGAGEGHPVELAAVLTAGGHVRQLRFTARLFPLEGDLSLSLQRESEALQRSMGDHLAWDRQILPEKSPFGAKADWTVPAEGLPWEIAGLLLLGLCGLLFSRTDALKRRLKRKKADFEREIPSMSMQMILLLDAGLTVDGAFQRLIRETRERDHPLYRAFADLAKESEATNLPFVNALYVYARQSGMRDLIRFSSLALDCSGRGSELAEKLDRERQQSWNGRLNQAKARAREAETKLCLPLMILLMVLVVIAIAPALLEL